MSMEKYAVTDRKKLQEEELVEVKHKIFDLHRSWTKTASEDQELDQALRRKAELESAIADQ